MPMYDERHRKCFRDIIELVYTDNLFKNKFAFKDNCLNLINININFINLTQGEYFTLVRHAS